MTILSHLPRGARLALAVGTASFVGLTALPTGAAADVNDDSGVTHEGPPSAWGPPLEEICEKQDYAAAAAAGYNVIIGTPLPDTIVGTAASDAIFALEGDDTVDGLYRDDLICLGSGDDRARGNYGNDAVFGEEGDDRILGNPGNDFLDGGPGLDVCIGGPGVDALVNC